MAASRAPAAPADAAVADRIAALLGPGLLALAALAAAALLSLPAARGYSSGFGWMPLWLAALPASAGVALWLGRRMDGRPAQLLADAALPRRRRGPAAVATTPRRRPAAPVRQDDRRAA